jgi:exodeoxyribonuclease-5
MGYTLSDEVISKLETLGSSEIDPKSNLQTDTEAPSYELEDETISLATNIAKSTNSNKFGSDNLNIDPNEYDFQLSYNTNNDLIRADRQSAVGMLSKGMGRLVGTAATKYLAGLGYMATAVPSIITGDMNTMLDNGWSSMFNSLEENIKEELPIYKTRKYLEGSLLDQALTLGFWTDDVVDGAAFMLSALIGAKGMSAIGKEVGAYSKLAKTFSKYSIAAKTGERVGETSMALQKWVDASTLATISTLNSVSEAAFEAKDVKDSIMTSFRGDIESGRMTEEEAKLKSAEAAKTTFWMNMALLSPSNLLETAMFLKGGAKLGLNKLFGEGILGSVEKAGKKEVKAITKTQLLGVFAKDAIGSAISEGAYEENSQTALTNYVTTRALGKEEDTPLLKGLYRNWKENFSTKEGQKSILLGALIGLGPGGYGGMKEAKAKSAEELRHALVSGTYSNMSKTGLNDLFKRRVTTDSDGNAVEGEHIIENGELVLDDDKVAAVYGKSKDQYLRYIEGLKALYNGNSTAYDFIRNDSFANYAFDIFHEGGTLDHLNDMIGNFAGRELEDIDNVDEAEEEKEVNKEELDKLKQSYTNKAKTLDKIYNSIANNYGGLANFGKSIKAQNYKQFVIKSQFVEAARQQFLSDKIKELEEVVRKGKVAGKGTIEGVEGLIDVSAAEDIKNGKEAAKQLNYMQQQLVASKERMIDLLDFKKQQSIFDEAVRVEREMSEGRDKADDDATTAAKATTRQSDEPRSVRISPTETTDKFTLDQAATNGYTHDEQRSKLVNEDSENTNPSYFYKVNDADSSVHIIYTDGTEEGNIINDRTLIGREVIDPTTGERGRVTLNYLNDKLERASTFNFETGETTHHDVNAINKSLGQPATPNQSAQVFYNVMPQMSGWQYENNPVSTVTGDTMNALGEYEVQQRSLDQHRNDVKQELIDNISEVVNRVNSDKKNAFENPSFSKVVEGLDRVTPNDLFNLNGNYYAPAVYNGLEGYLKQDGENTVFVDSKSNKEYIVAGSQSSKALSDLNVTLLNHTTVDIVYETDGRPYPIKIGDKYYKNPNFANPASAIETYQGIPVAVTLVDVNGQAHRFTKDFIVQDVAYSIEMNEALMDRVFDFRLFGDNSDAIIVTDPKTGVDYAVYRKDGQYEVYFLREGEATKGYKKVNPQAKIYNRVVVEFKNIFNKALGETSKLNPKTEKQIKDGIKSNVQDARSATPGEALAIPEQREVENSKRIPKEESTKSESEVTSGLEDEINKALEQKAAIEAEAQRRLAEQETATSQATTLVDMMEAGDTVETMDEDESKNKPDRNDEEWTGTINSNDSLGYIHYDDNNKQFVVNNGDFLRHTINNAVQGTGVIAEINYDYREFWDLNKDLESKIKSGNLSQEEIESILNQEVTDKELLDIVGNEYREFNTLADLIPIKYVFKDGDTTFKNGIHAHQSNFKYVTTDGETTAEKAESRKAKMTATRGTRRSILSNKLAGNTISFPMIAKTTGHFNTHPKENISVSKLFEQLDLDPRTAEFGIGEAEGMVYFPNEEFSIPNGSKGNVYWFTRNTANGDKILAKLNPGKLTREHAEIALKALQQANSGMLTTKYEGSDVTGDLTVGEVLKHLVVSGKKVTEVLSNNKSKSRYVNKQLWTTKDGKLRYGTNTIDLFNHTKEEKEDFLKWMTTNKNYPVSKPFLGKKLSWRNMSDTNASFSIGSTMKYDSKSDNYSSFIADNSLNTRLRVVPGTKSITTNPTLIMDPAAPIINGANNNYKSKPEAYKLEPSIQPDTKAKKTEATESTVSKEVSKKANEQASTARTEVYLSDFNAITRAPIGTHVYLYNPSVSAKKFTIGRVVGDKFFVNPRFEGSLEYLTSKIGHLGAVDLTNAADLLKIKNAIAPFSIMLHVDIPARKVEEVVKENETEKESPLKQEPTLKTKASKTKPKSDSKFDIKGSIIDSGFGEDLVLDVNDGSISESDQDSLSQINKFLADEIGVTGDILALDEGFYTLNVDQDYTDKVNEYLGNTEKEVKEEPTVSVKKDTKQDSNPNAGFIDTGARDFDDVDFFREVPNTQGDYKEFNSKKATKWLRSKLGNKFDVDIVDGLIELAHDKHAFGQARIDSILLSSAAEVGTEYHEAFHRVSLFLLSKEERLNFYEKARSEYKLKNVSNKEVEEFLAEEFRNYMLLKEEGYERGIIPAIKRFFQRIFNYIKTVFVGPRRLNEASILQLFNMIDDGRFKRSHVDKNRLKELRGTFANFETRDTVFDNIQSSEEYKEVVQFLFRNLMQASGLVLQSSNLETKKGEILINLKNGVQDLDKLSYSLLKDRLNRIKNDYLSIAKYNPDPAKQQRATKLADIVIELLDNNKFKAVRQDLEDYLMSLNINSINDDTDIDNADEIDEETGESKSNKDSFGGVSFESSAKHNNTSANIKLLLSILPANNVSDTKTGLPRFSEFGPTWSELLRASVNVVTVDDMIKVLENKSKGNFTFATLLKYVNQDENLKTQLWGTVSKTRLYFDSCNIESSDNNLIIKFGDALIKSSDKELVKSWNSGLERNKNLFTFKQGENPVPNTEYFNSLNDKYIKLYAQAFSQYNKSGAISNFDAVSSDLRGLLGEVGIVLKDEEFNAVLRAENENQDIAILRLMNNRVKHIFSEKGTLYGLFNGVASDNKKIKFYNALSNEKGVNFIARQVSSLYGEALSDSLLAHQGKRFYLVSQHTNITNQINDFKKNKVAEIDTKLSAVFNKRSLWLNYFKNNPEALDTFQLRTLSSIYKEGEQDKGRGYQDVTDVEEYLIRLNAWSKYNKDGIGYAVLPTPADRSFYQYLSGVPKINVQLDDKFQLNNDVLHAFHGYYADEKDRVELTRSQVDNVIAMIKGEKEAGDFRVEDLVENLHFTHKDPYDSEKAVVGKGETVIATDANNNWVILKEGETALHGNGKLLKKVNPKTRVESYIGRGANFQIFTNSGNFKSFTDYANRILNDRIDDELEYAAELGLIGKEGDKYINYLIPTEIINKHKELVGDNMNLVLRNIIADNTINTISAGLEYSKMFASDISSFKKVADYLKRITGYTSTGDNLRTDFPSGIYENDELITSNTYNVTTFNSHEVFSELYDGLVEKFSNYYVDKLGMDEEAALELAESKLIPYAHTDQTDAQTFITNEMYRALSVKLGEWSDLKEEAYKMLTSGKKLDHDQWVASYNLVSHPLKLTYMKTYQNNGQSYSVFDKMSLATLFRPTVEGTMMEELLDRMELKGKYANKGLPPIHQIKFHTAEKSGIKDRRSIYSDSTETSFTDLNLLSVYPQEFKWLRKQLVTDPHESTTIDLGTQLKKIAISNIRFGDKYVNKFDENEEMTGMDLVKEVHNVIGELSDRGAEGFKDEMNLDDNFVVTDKKALVDKLRDEARKANMPQHIIEALKIDKTTNDFYMDLDSMPDARRWVQSRLVSLIKKATIDLPLPGGSFIQMTNLGLNKIDKSDELKWDTKNGFVEAQVSVNLFKSIIPGYKNKTHKQRVEYLNKHPELYAMAYRVPTQGQGSTIALKVVKWLPENTGDVIVLPTEVTKITGADFDVDKMFIVRHNYENGERIKYLTEANSSSIERANHYANEAIKDKIKDIYKDYLTRSDVAIEGIEDYEELVTHIKSGLRKSMDSEIELAKKEWVDANLSEFSQRPIVKQNTTKAVQNRLLDMYFTVWHNENHTIHRYQPLGFGAEKLKNLAYKVKDQWEKQPNVDSTPLLYLSPKEQLDVKSRFKFGGKGIGPNALANVHHILSQYVDLGLFYDLGVGNTVEVALTEEEIEELSNEQDRLAKSVDPTVDRYELFPGVMANDEQKLAIDELLDFIKSETSRNDYAVLEGKAGTGKTTIIKKVLEQFPNRNIIVGALSNKAKSALYDSINDVDLKKIKYHTIASMLSMTRNDETGDFELDPYNNTPPPIISADIIIIDEASMVNESALSNILSFKKNNSKLIFLGDTGQLPPIRKETDPLMDADSKAFDTKFKSDLKTRVRQGEDSPILPFADKFWNNSHSSNPVLYPFSDEDRVNKITKNGNIIFTDSKSAIPIMLDQFKEAVIKNNPNLIRLVGYRTATVDSYNKYIHEYLFPTGEEYNKGELIIFNSSYTDMDIGEVIDNSSEFQIKSVKKGSLGEYTGYLSTVELIDENGNTKDVNLPLLDKASKIRHSKKVSDLFNAAKNMPKGPNRAMAYKEAWYEKDKYPNVSYSYAITSHKSQGSTYNTSVVLEDDIMGVKPTTNKSKSQSMYTAITRAKNNVLMISNRNSKNNETPALIKEEDRPIKTITKKENTSPQVEKEIKAPTPTPTTKPVTSLSKLIGKDGEYITEWFSALVDAHVDIAADPWIYYLNANDYTNPSITLLLRAGVGGLETFKFIAQPILKQVAKSQENKDNKLGIDTTYAVSNIIKSYMDMYINMGGSKEYLLEGKAALQQSINDQERLEHNIQDFGNNNLSFEYYKNQLEIWNAFKYLRKPSNDLKDVILSSRIDTKKIGSTTSSIKAYDNKARKLLKMTAKGTGIRNFDKLFTDTYLGAQTDNAIGMSNAVIGSTLLEGTPAFTKLHDHIMMLSGKTFSANEEYVNNISNAIYTQIVSDFFINTLKMTTADVAALFTNNSIPKTIDDIQSGSKWPEIKNNPLFTIFRSEYKEGPDFLSVNKPDDPFHINSIVSGWKELYSSPNPDIRKFSEDLFKYSFFSSGFKSTANSFHNLAPKELIKGIGFDIFMKETKKKARMDSNYFAHMTDDIIQNMWSNDDVVPTVPASNIRDSILYGSIISISNIENYIGENDKHELVGRPYIKTKVIGKDGVARLGLFKFVGITGVDQKLVYYKVPNKGYKKNGFHIVENSLSKSLTASNYEDITQNINDENFEKYVNFKLNGKVLSVPLSNTKPVDRDSEIILYADGIDISNSEQLRKDLLINPIEAYSNVTDEVISELTNASGDIQLNLNLPSAWYSLPNGQIFFLENRGKNVYTVGQKTYRTPTYSERAKKIDECK